MNIEFSKESIKIELKNVLHEELIPVRRDSPKKLKTGNITIVNPKIPKLPGVYFLFNKHKKLLYVGQGISIRNRIAMHTYNIAFPASDMEPKDIDFVFYLLVENKIKRNMLETLYIHIYNPPFNKTKFNCTKPRRREYEEMSFEDAQKLAKEAREKIEKKVEDKFEVNLVYCKSCGKQIVADSKFCRYCGVEQ